MPWALQVTAACAAAVVAWLAVNVVYQVVRKPTELFFPVSGTLYKVPAETWDTYAPLFERHSTPLMSPELLAALAQVEGSGNPLVRTYWRWRWTHEPFEIYRPASSAVGMYQITDGTFGEARRYCIRRHAVAERGAWYDWRACWFNSLYFRVVPSHAVELTSAYLDRRVGEIAARHGNGTLEQRRSLAALVHLCGAGAGASYARRGYTLAPGQKCGAHEARVYLDKVAAMTRTFAALRAAKR